MKKKRPADWAEEKTRSLQIRWSKWVDNLHLWEELSPQMIGEPREIVWQLEIRDASEKLGMDLELHDKDEILKKALEYIAREGGRFKSEEKK